MSSIDLAKLADILADKTDYDKASVYNAIDSLIARRNPGWTESVTAIVSIIAVTITLFIGGLTGYLNLREPLSSVIKDVERMELFNKDLCHNIGEVEGRLESLKDLHTKESIHNKYLIESIEKRLYKVEIILGERPK